MTLPQHSWLLELVCLQFLFHPAALLGICVRALSKLELFAKCSIARDRFEFFWTLTANGDTRSDQCHPAVQSPNVRMQRGSSRVDSGVGACSHSWISCPHFKIPSVFQWPSLTLRADTQPHPNRTYTLYSHRITYQTHSHSSYAGSHMHAHSLTHSHSSVPLTLTLTHSLSLSLTHAHTLALALALTRAAVVVRDSLIVLATQLVWAMPNSTWGSLPLRHQPFSFPSLLRASLLSHLLSTLH